MTRLIALPVAVIAAALAMFVGGSFAGEAPEAAGSKAGRQIGTTADFNLAIATADKAAEENSGDSDESAGGDRAFKLFSGEAGSLNWNSNGELSELIDELVASGELTEAGAEKLRESLKDHTILRMHSPVDLNFNGAGKGMGNMFFSPDGEHNRMFNFQFKGEDDGRKLEIRIEDDGNVVVEGEGYSDEELAELQQQIEKQHAEGKPIMLFDNPIMPHVFSWDGESDKEFSFSFPELDGNEWIDENGIFDLEKFNERFPGHKSFEWKNEDGAVMPHMFMFQEHDGELREQVEQMVREILRELGVEHSRADETPSTSA